MTTATRTLYELQITEKLEHRFRNDRREEAVYRRINAGDRWNEFADANAETVLYIPGKQALSFVEVEVLRVDEGAWTYRAEAHLHNSACCGPFNTNRTLPTRDKAVRSGIGQILAWALRQTRRPSEATDAKLS